MENSHPSVLERVADSCIQGLQAKSSCVIWATAKVKLESVAQSKGDCSRMFLLPRLRSPRTMLMPTFELYCTSEEFPWV